MRTTTAAVSLLTVLAGLTTGSAAATEGSASSEKKPAKAAASVHGKARISYIESADHDIRFTIDAEQVPFSRPVLPVAPNGLATDARGTLKFSHTAPGGAAGWAEARIDCLVTSGRTATLTAIVTKSNVEKPGARLGISVQQGGKGEPDRLGFSWGVVNIVPDHVDDNGIPIRPQAGTCMAPAPFTTVVKGGFKVVHAEIRKTPTRL
ncbi:hypothetical protein GCM10010232_02920 [Streptomyces amakusaensis]|uniref:Uncharacterized protein n=1 Tax=Streptomyces amakusaensis TaxID=67271 RepID=A0ABW0AK84_9ACTN